MEKNEAHRETLNENEPDIVEKINAHIRQEKENQKSEMENKKKREKELSHLYDDILSEEEKIKTKCSTSLKKLRHLESKIGDLVEIQQVILSCKI